MMNVKNVGVYVMVCKRGHSNWFMTKRIGRKTKVCEFIMAHRQKEGVGDKVLFCGDLPKNKKISKGWIALS
jgi:hypothetical protein